jgi:hypothetical protein
LTSNVANAEREAAKSRRGGLEVQVGAIFVGSDNGSAVPLLVGDEELVGDESVGKGKYPLVVLLNGTYPDANNKQKQSSHFQEAVLALHSLYTSSDVSLSI